MEKILKKNKAFYRLVFKTTLPVFAGYLVLGSGCGIMLADKGYGPIWALFMSVFMYAGSGQYLACELMAEGASIITTVVATLLVQARHAFYGLSLIERYRGGGFKKFYMIHTITDETYSIVSTIDLPEGVNERKFYFAVSLLDHIYWIFGCVLGCVLGTALSFNTKGVDFALTALFVCIFTDKWITSRDHTSAIIGVCSAVLCLLLFGPEKFLIPAMLLITLCLSFLKKIENIENKNKGEGDKNA